MLPSFAALDLRRTVAPTGVALGPRAIIRRVDDFTARFHPYAVDAPLSAADDAYMNVELDSLRNTLTAEGPAELALKRALEETQPNADGDVVVQMDIVRNAQAEFADKEFALQMLRKMWKVTSTRSHVARKLITRNVLEAVVKCLSVRRFADDLSVEAIGLLNHLTATGTTGSFLLRWSLVVTYEQADALIKPLLAFVHTTELTTDRLVITKHALSLLRSLLDAENDTDRTDESPMPYEADDDVAWGESYYRIRDEDVSIFDAEPYNVARTAARTTDGALEKLLTASELMVVWQGAANDRSHIIEVSRLALHVLEDVVFYDARTTKKFLEVDGVNRIMRVFYGLNPATELRENVLDILLYVMRGASRDKIPFDQPFAAMLPGLLAHWRQVQANPNLAGAGKFWALLRQVSQHKQIKDVLLLSDDGYHMLRDASDRQWNPGGGALRAARMGEAYTILFYTLTEPTTFEMWNRFVEYDRDIYWAESIFADLWDESVEAAPSWKMRLVAKMLENRHQTFAACMIRLPEKLMRNIVTPFVYWIYKGKNDLDDRFKNALTMLASNGMLWDAISKQIKKHEEEEDWGQGNWSDVVAVLNDDDVLAQAAVSNPYPSSVAALVLLHKLNEAHAELLSTRPLSSEDRALLKQRQEQYEPVLEAIENEHVGHNEQHGAILEKAVAFARKLLALPSLQNPQLDALREEFNNKRKRPGNDDAGPSTSTEAPVGSGAAFVSLLAYVSR